MESQQNYYTAHQVHYDCINDILLRHPPIMSIPDGCRLIPQISCSTSSNLNTKDKGTLLLMQTVNSDYVAHGTCYMDMLQQDKEDKQDKDTHRSYPLRLHM